MRWTRSELESWRGREALDADAEPVGQIAATFLDDATGAPRWLAVRTGAHGDEVSPVPVAGAEPTGAAIRLPHPAGTIRAAPHLPPGADLTRDQDEQLTSLYGLREQPAPKPRPAGGGPGADPAVIASLRSMHALERDTLSRLQGLQSMLEDAELRHDVTRHLHETERHEAAVAGRLEELDAGRSALRDALGTLTAKSASAKAKAASEDVPALLRDALAFEQREAAAYARLAELAKQAGDAATARLAGRIRADEVAMGDTVSGALRRMGQQV